MAKGKEPSTELGTNENLRGSLRIDCYLPLWFRPVSEEDVKKVKSQISDYAVQRHVLDHGDEDDAPEDGDLRIVFNKINRLQRNIRHYLEQIRTSEKHPYQTFGITLSATGCSVRGLKSNQLQKEADWVEVHLLLPTHPLDVFIFGKVVRPGIISFDMIASDQEDWIIEYLIHRQQEDIRLANKK